MFLSAKLIHCLPLSERLGLSRKEAADIVGCSMSLFDKLVKAGKMPEPTKISNRRIWHRLAVERAFNELFSSKNFHSSANSWDDLLK